MRRREAPEAFGLSVVDMFTCMFLMTCVLYMLEAPQSSSEGRYRRLPGIRIEAKAPAYVNVMVVTPSGSLTTWTGDSQFKRSASEAVQLFANIPPGSELRIFANPASTDADLLVELRGSAFGKKTVTLTRANNFREVVPWP